LSLPQIVFNKTTQNIKSMTTVDQFPSETRLWIYQSSKPLSDEAVAEAEAKMQTFAQKWVSHNRQLKASAQILHNRFLILMVDESQADASGCSIDKSVYFLKQLQAEYGVDLFDRMIFSYQKDGQVHSVPREDFIALYHRGEIDDHTLVFDTLVDNKAAFDQGWLKPLAQSWHKRLV
jgi:hypothetical protein